MRNILKYKKDSRFQGLFRNNRILMDWFEQNNRKNKIMLYHYLILIHRLKLSEDTLS